MNIVQIGIGLVFGVSFGVVAVWFLDRRHQRTVQKLIESRRKIERQRTQAVNDLFAFRSEAGNLTAAANNMDAAVRTGEHPSAELVAEMENLRSLIGRADAALASARERRDIQDAEISQLRTQVELLTSGDQAEIIDLRPPTNAQYNVSYGQV